MDSRSRDNFRKLLGPFKSPVVAREEGPTWSSSRATGDYRAEIPRTSSSHRERLGGNGGAKEMDFGGDMEDDVPLDAFGRAGLLFFPVSWPSRRLGH
jgi:hypothetical protein